MLNKILKTSVPISEQRSITRRPPRELSTMQTSRKKAIPANNELKS
jgi:hypothetical protein